MKNLFLLFITMLLLFSCTKEGKTISVEGRVYNPLTDEGIEGIELRVFEGTSSGGAPASQSSDSRRIDETFTNEDGVYQLSGVALGLGATLRLYTSSSKDYYFVGMSDNTITGEFSEFSTIGISSGKHNKVDFWMVPYGELRLDIRNINCEGQEDKLFYKRIWLSFDDSTNGVTRFGCHLYIGDYFQLPIGEYKYEWEVTRGGITNYHDTIFTILENGQHTVTIHY